MTTPVVSASARFDLVGDGEDRDRDERDGGVDRQAHGIDRADLHRAVDGR